MAAIVVSFAWTALDLMAGAFNLVAGALHQGVEALVPHPVLSMVITTVLLASLSASILTAISMIAYLSVLRPAFESWKEKRRRRQQVQQPAQRDVVSASGSTIHTAASARSAAGPLQPTRSLFSRLSSFFLRAPKNDPPIALKLRVQGEAMWHRLWITKAQVRSLPELHQAIRNRLALAAMEAPSNTLQGFSVEDLAGAAKILQVVLAKEGVVVGSEDIASLKEGDELEVQLKA